MAVSVAMSATPNYVSANFRIPVSAVFTNGGASAVTISSISEIHPMSKVGATIDATTKLVGLSIPAGGSAGGVFSVVFPTVPGVTQQYTMAMGFLFSDATEADANALVFNVLPPLALTTQQQINLNPAGSMNFASNVQSGLITAALQ